MNGDILAHLLYVSQNTGKNIDFEKALTYPLSEIPLSLCNANGSLRKKNKSCLSHIVLATANELEHREPLKEETVYIFNLMALVRMMREIPETYLKIFPLNYCLWF